MDSILVPYGSAQIHSMTSAEKSNLDNLLKQQDPDLLDWFLGKTTPEDASIADAVRDVLAFSNEGERAKGLESAFGSTRVARTVSSRSEKR